MTLPDPDQPKLTQDDLRLREPKLAHLSAPVERRLEPRKPAQGRVRAVSTSPEGASCVTPAEMVDESVAGVGLLSAVPMDIGDTIEVYPFSQPVATVHGEVVRCELIPGGAWSIGLRRRMAMAIAR